MEQLPIKQIFLDKFEFKLFHNVHCDTFHWGQQNDDEPVSPLKQIAQVSSIESFGMSE